MKAAVCPRYGPPEAEHLVEIETPKPKERELLVKVLATTVNRTDCGHRRARPFFMRAGTGLWKPKVEILGCELAGEVLEVGTGVTQFKTGDRVFGVTANGMGTHAEFVCLGERDSLAPTPNNMSDEEAAAVCIGALQALVCLRSAKVASGQRILIYGASGSIGTAAVQLAKFFGAHVTAVCNTKNLDVVRSLNADDVIDYTVDDFTRNGETYDVIFDAVGKHSFARCRGSLVRGGIFSVSDLGFLWQNLPLALLTAIAGKKRVKLPMVRGMDYSKEVFFIRDLIEAGRYVAVIDRCYPFSQIVDATRYVETEQKTGNVVIRMSPHVGAREAVTHVVIA